jgi:hypothetical protein
MWLLKVVRSPGCDEELRNGPEVKIDILDEGYRSPEVFRGAPGIRRKTEWGFGRPRQALGGLMGQGGKAHQPTKGLCAPHTPSHMNRRVGAPP